MESLSSKLLDKIFSYLSDHHVCNVIGLIRYKWHCLSFSSNFGWYGRVLRQQLSTSTKRLVKNDSVPERILEERNPCYTQDEQGYLVLSDDDVLRPISLHRYARLEGQPDPENLGRCWKKLWCEHTCWTKPSRLVHSTLYFTDDPQTESPVQRVERFAENQTIIQVQGAAQVHWVAMGSHPGVRPGGVRVAVLNHPGLVCWHVATHESDNAEGAHALTCLFATGSSDGSIKVFHLDLQLSRIAVAQPANWEVHVLQATNHLHPSHEGISAVFVAAPQLYAGTADGHLYIWNSLLQKKHSRRISRDEINETQLSRLQNARAVAERVARQEVPHITALMYQRGRILVGTSLGLIRIFDAKKFRLIVRLAGHSVPVNSFSSKGRAIWSHGGNQECYELKRWTSKIGHTCKPINLKSASRCRSHSGIQTRSSESFKSNSDFCNRSGNCANDRQPTSPRRISEDCVPKTMFSGIAESVSARFTKVSLDEDVDFQLICYKFHSSTLVASFSSGQLIAYETATGYPCFLFKCIPDKPWNFFFGNNHNNSEWLIKGLDFDQTKIVGITMSGKVAVWAWHSTDPICWLPIPGKVKCTGVKLLHGKILLKTEQAGLLSLGFS